MREFTDKSVMKQIAIWKANHPEETHKSLSERFGLPVHRVRYALQKNAELAETMKNTKRGRAIQSRYLAGSTDDLELLRKQFSFCVAELENDNSMAIASRIDLLNKIIRIKVYIQSVELQGHIKRTDAELIARIIKRFIPNATNEDIIKIYQEEFEKWKAEWQSK